MKIRLLISIDSSQHEIDISETTSPKDLEEFIKNDLGYTDKAIRILFQGRSLSGSSTLSSLGVHDNDLLQIILFDVAPQQQHRTRVISDDSRSDEQSESEDEERARGLEALLEAGVPPGEVLAHRCNLILRVTILSHSESQPASRALRLFSLNSAHVGDSLEACAGILHELYRDERRNMFDAGNTQIDISGGEEEEEEGVLGDSEGEEGIETSSVRATIQPQTTSTHPRSYQSQDGVGTDLDFFPNLSPSGRPLEQRIIDLEERWLNGDELDLPGLPRVPGQDQLAMGNGLIGLMAENNDFEPFMAMWKTMALIAIGMVLSFVLGTTILPLLFAKGIPLMLRVGFVAGVFANIIVGSCLSVSTAFY
ncbi:hypothetical protein ADUPG1_009646 [Aduncisulcus paluster]|uniref:Ubiquitin-like domain-containing protein n=1 Tax=Aduncisulcus paluster TaxID=2918883 RepID=A0ABQ5KWE2_9EUKA|nr:hypothetical protein ADUPG1_009646 [Aduncisulcus paluster]